MDQTGTSGMRAPSHSFRLEPAEDGVHYRELRKREAAEGNEPRIERGLSWQLAAFNTFFCKSAAKSNLRQNPL